MKEGGKRVASVSNKIKIKIYKLILIFFYIFLIFIKNVVEFSRDGMPRSRINSLMTTDTLDVLKETD